LAASREGKLVLAQDRANNAFAIKRYHSEKTRDAKHAERDTWRHQRIRLISLNPDYPSWDLTPEEDKYRILAEFLTVLG
jgi:hypothetical protein